MSRGSPLRYAGPRCQNAPRHNQTPAAHTHRAGMTALEHTSVFTEAPDMAMDCFPSTLAMGLTVGGDLVRTQQHVHFSCAGPQVAKVQARDQQSALQTHIGSTHTHTSLVADLKHL
eukprot:144417-Amphidinium_carterae.2